MNKPNLKYLTACTLLAIGASTGTAMAEPTLEMSGLVEVEINSGKDHTAAKGSDIVLSTVEIGLDSQINENVSASVLILHEDDDTEPPVIDEATMTITKDAFFLTAGRMYIPFGNFETNMVSDPLTLEIAETQEAAIQVGYEANGLSASIYAFNGGADKVGTDKDVVDDFGISLGYSMKAGAVDLDLGIDYINNMAETDGIEGALAGPIQDHTAGTAIHAIASMDNMQLIVEYISASDDFNVADLGFNGGAARPSASNIEFSYTVNDYTIAIAHQTSDEIDGSALPETRNMISVSTTVAGDVGLVIEYSDADDYETADGGTGESGGMLTAQLAVEF